MDNKTEKVAMIAASDAPPEKAAKTVPMIRPEDRSADPVIAQVKPDELENWKKHGWTVKE